MRIKDKLQHIIKNSLIKLEISKQTNEIIIESSKDNIWIFYTNLPITLAKELHKKPEEIAEILKKTIKDEIIQNIEVIYPGTLNIIVNKKYLLTGISKIIEKNINYGKSTIGASKTINIDFINSDFTEKVNIESIFNAIYGDNLSRILKYNGFEVTTEYYLNDTSDKIDALADFSKKRYEQICKYQYNASENINKTNMRDTATDLYTLYKDSKLSEQLEYFKKEEISTLLDIRKYELDKYRINFNTYTKEQNLYDKGLIDLVLDKLNKKGYTYFYNDELWLKTTDFKDDKDRLLIKSEGTYTSILPLIAYHIDRLQRKYTGLINIYNISNKENEKIIIPIIKMLEQDINKLEIKVLPEIKLIKDNRELIDINNIPKDINVNEIRYLFANQNIDENILINLDILTQKNKDNPFYYIENTNITIHQLLKSYNKKITKVKKFSTIDNELAYIMVNKLYEFEDIIIISALKQKPHLICNYLKELSIIFNDYYNSEKIITEDEEYTNERLNLLLAIKIVINNALDLIGIIPREEL